MSSSFGNWFGKSKKQVSQPEPEQKPPAAPKQTPGADHLPGAPYKKVIPSTRSPSSLRTRRSGSD